MKLHTDTLYYLYTTWYNLYAVKLQNAFQGFYFWLIAYTECSKTIEHCVFMGS